MFNMAIFLWPIGDRINGVPLFIFTGSRDGCVRYRDWSYLWNLSLGGFCSGTIDRSLGESYVWM